MNSLDCEGTAADEAVANKPAVAVHKIKPRMFSQFSDQKIDKERESEYVQMKYVASECLLHKVQTKSECGTAKGCQ